MGKKNELTREELKYFKKAEDIVYNSSKSKKVNKSKGESKSNKKIIIAISACVVIIIALLFCTIFALINIKNNKIIKNVYVMGVNVEKLTKEEAVNKLNQHVEKRINSDLVFKHNDQTFSLTPKEIDFNYSFEDAVNEAYNVGRTGNIFQNNFTILKHFKEKTNIMPEVSLNQELYNNIEGQINGQLTDGVKEPQSNIDGKKLIITKGKNGYKVSMEGLKKLIINKMLETDYDDSTIEIPVVEAKCSEVDIDKIYKEVYKAPVNASYTKNPFKIIASQTGLDFAISLEDAKKMLQGDEQTCTIPLKTLYPKVTTDQIGTEAFPNLLGSYSSNYSSSGANRANNVYLAASKINGTVLMPGETFSYNNTVGKRTVQAGFREAGAYANGGVVSAVGGGICQVSSTLYNAVLRANLEIKDRSNHMFVVGYVPIGTDATVSWGAPDFKFKNNRNYPIKIVATTGGRNVYVKIYGLKQDNDYDVQILSYKTGSIPFKTTYTTDKSLGKGVTKVIQSGSNGAYSVTYKILKRNGREVSRVLVSKDTYQPHNQIIAKGE